MLLWGHQPDVNLFRDCAYLGQGKMQPQMKKGALMGAGAPLAHRAPGSECGQFVTLDLMQGSFEGHPTTSLCPGLLFGPQRQKDFPCVATGNYIWNFPCPRLWLQSPILSPSSQQIIVEGRSSISVLFWQLSSPGCAGEELVGRGMKVTPSEERGDVIPLALAP